MAKKVVRRELRHQSPGLSVVGDITAAVASNVGQPGQVTRTSTKTSTRIVQRSGRTRAKPTHAEPTETKESAP